MAGIVSKSYCDALFSLAQEDNKLDTYKEQLILISKSVKSNAQYRAIMTHPKISKEEKKEMIDMIYGKTVDHTLLNFIKLLVDKGRFRAIEDITKEFIKNYNIVNDIQVVYVKSATALKEDEVVQLKEKLEHKLHKKIDFILSVDADLLAGIRIKINDSIIDNTALGRLNRLKHSVMNISETNK